MNTSVAIKFEALEIARKVTETKQEGLSRAAKKYNENKIKKETEEKK